MGNLRNHVQLIGNIGDVPSITILESGKKAVRFKMATNDYYKNANGEKVKSTDWHSVVAWGKTADLLEEFGRKGKEIGLVGKLRTRSYTVDDGSTRYVTEVVVDEILLLGNRA